MHLQVRSAARKAEVEAVRDGKSPFFQKKSALREQALVAQYEKLEKSGSLNKFLAKRRKKVATKQHKKVPLERRGFSDADWAE